MTEIDDRAWFAKYQHLFHESGYSSPPIELYRFIHSLARWSGRTLELGSGNGLLLRYLVDHSEEWVEAHGVDVNQPLIESAGRNIFPARPQAFISADASSFLVERAAYKFILCNPLYADQCYRGQVDDQMAPYEGGAPVRDYVQKCMDGLTPGGHLVMFCYLGQAEQLNWRFCRFLADIGFNDCQMRVSSAARAMGFVRAATT